MRSAIWDRNIFETAVWAATVKSGSVVYKLWISCTICSVTGTGGASLAKARARLCSPVRASVATLRAKWEQRRIQLGPWTTGQASLQSRKGRVKLPENEIKEEPTDKRENFPGKLGSCGVVHDGTEEGVLSLLESKPESYRRLDVGGASDISNVVPHDRVERFSSNRSPSAGAAMEG